MLERGYRGKICYAKSRKQENYYFVAEPPLIGEDYTMVANQLEIEGAPKISETSVLNNGAQVFALGPFDNKFFGKNYGPRQDREFRRVIGAIANRVGYKCVSKEVRVIDNPDELSLKEVA